jgi:NADH:ubiquinone oxidoreductase subunit E
MSRHLTLARRQAIKVVASGLGLAALQPHLAAAQQKVAKLDARYQEHPNGTQHCALCMYYIAPVECKLVRGEVSPNGWCNFFHSAAG